MTTKNNNQSDSVQIDYDRKSLSYSTTDGCFYSIMLGIGENYFQPWAIFLSVNSFYLGLIATLPLFIGALAQNISLVFLDKLRSVRSFVLWGVILQAIVWIPIFCMPVLFPSCGTFLLLIFAVAYFAFVHFVTPAWNVWMGELIPVQIRGSYFGRRNKMAALFTLVGIIIGGLILDIFRKLELLLIGFGIIFGAACIARFLSAYCLVKVRNVELSRLDVKEKFSFIDFLCRGTKSNFLRFVLLVTFVYFAAFIVGPYVALYILRDLQFSYIQFFVITLSTFAAQFMTFDKWGALSDKFGNVMILRLNAFLSAVLPLLWIISSNFYYLTAVMAVTGIVWGGFNLCASNFIFDAVTPAKRARCVAYYNLLVMAGVFAGSTFGGLLIPHLSGEINLIGVTIFLSYPLHALFFLSALFRLMVAMIFGSSVREVKEVEAISPVRAILYVVGFKPISSLGTEIFTGGQKEND
ncbi:MAG: MFS transporter [Planctomycetes bacterium]|nr:MFS transporter [Planctomycetota bacterium]